MSANPVVSHAPTSSDGKELEFGDAVLSNAFQVKPPPKQSLPMREFRGNTLGQSFHMVERMKRSREHPMIGYWLAALPNTGVARLLGQAGFDFIALDWEHTPYASGNQHPSEMGRTYGCAKMVVDAAKKHDIACFMSSFFPMADAILSQGFTMTTVGFDGFGFAQHLRACLSIGHAQLADWKARNADQ